MSAKKMVPAKVKNFWEKRAAQEDISPENVTHKDIWQRWLEIAMIGGYLRRGARVLDVGCGNGYSTRIFAALCREIVGIDYSGAMIKRATQESRKKVRGGPPPQFHQCDVLDLSPELYGKFDIATSERCLINLDSFEKQKKAIANIASVLKPRGRFIFVEGSAEGRLVLNRFRKMFGLPEMPRVWHNLDFREIETFLFLKKYFTVEERRHFGTYDFLSRIVHPLLVSPQEPRYDARINEIAAKVALEAQEFGQVSRVLFLVLRKK